MATLQLPAPVSPAAVTHFPDPASFAVRETTRAEPPKPRLLDRVRAALRARHYERLEGTPRLMAYLLYGAGLRLLDDLHPRPEPRAGGRAEPSGPDVRRTPVRVYRRSNSRMERTRSRAPLIRALGVMKTVLRATESRASSEVIE